jgi:transcriptional regulator with XRE-family HTH domain
MAHMIGEKIREIRLSQDRSLADVAAKAKVSVATLSRVENDKQAIDLELFLTLARILNTSPTELLGEHGRSDEKGDPLARRIAALGGRERLDLWRDLATERRAQRGKRRGSEAHQVAEQVEELVAQLDFLRDELDTLRKRIKKR